MKDGFIKVAAVSPRVHIADPQANKAEIIETAREAAAAGAKVIVYPELAISGYTAGDTYRQGLLIDESLKALSCIIDASEDIDAIIFIGTPWRHKGQLYDAAAVINRGNLLGVVPKTYLSDDEGLFESRYFVPAPEETSLTVYSPEEGLTEEIPFGTDLLFTCADMEGLTLAAEIGTDGYAVFAPSMFHAAAGATVIVNCSSGNEIIGTQARRRAIFPAHTFRLHCGYIFSGCGFGESTTDNLYPGQKLIASNGKLLKNACCRSADIIYAVIDTEQLVSERTQQGWQSDDDGYITVDFGLDITETDITGAVSGNPFIPADAAELKQRCEKVFDIQVLSLIARLEAINCKHVLIGLSGGLDSTLALLVSAEAFRRMQLPLADVHAVTMPCFGTSDRTHNNALLLAESLGVTLTEVNISDSVRQHFAEIGHDEADHDVTFENAQARERTQVLMDLANQENGLVVGTGDLSELALGWCTYNGDQMSNYAVNADVPKTLIRCIVRNYAETCGNDTLKGALIDIIDTPVSPELVPDQKTEDLVGPYDLHDLFLYYSLRYGYSPAKVYRIAKAAYPGMYSDEEIKKWLKLFYTRFFRQQFKRSASPDGPRIGSVVLSPRGGLMLPSDMNGNLWINSVDEL